MRLSSYLTFCFLIILALAGTAYPQAAKSELIGEVRDQNSALVPNAKVTLTNVATGQTSSQVSSDGSFILTNLKPGIYNVAVEADGFKQSLREGVRLATGERVRLDVVLDPGAVTELVTVVQDASLLRTESGGLGQVITNTFGLSPVERSRSSLRLKLSATGKLAIGPVNIDASNTDEAPLIVIEEERLVL